MQQAQAAVFDNASGAVGIDWAALAMRRLRWLLVNGLIVGVLGGLAMLARQPNIGVRAGSERPGELAVAWLGATLLMLAVARAERWPALRRLDIALGYLVVTCFMASIYRHWLVYAPEDVVRGVSPTAMLMLLFAAVVPVRPARMAVAVAAAALADVGALGLTLARGNPVPPWNLWLWLFAPNVFAAGLAVLTSRFLHNLSETLRKAREMGAYRLVKLIGSGGMGEVWRAEHRSLARPAAIKIIRPEILRAGSIVTKQLLTRFEREARSTATLTSPHTIEVYDFGRASDGAFFYVMELLEGMDLETMVAEHGALPQERVAHFMLQISHSLEDAHERGLIHRDIKPANLFICQRGADRDFAKVLDFGLVKMQSEDADESKLTLAGSMIGTASYMAPELARGGEATAQSDIYSFGCVAYWLLCGRQVFGGRDGGVPTVLAHLNEAPVAPGSLATVDPALESLVLACLAKQPAERPQSFAAISETVAATGLAQRWTRAHADEFWAMAEQSAGETRRTETAL